MNDKDRWSAHLEYLKVAITLATAILTASVAIFSDPSKLPNGNVKYILLLCVIFVFFTLISSIFGVIALCNFLIRPSDSSVDDLKITDRITTGAGLSFFFFLATALCVLIFAVVRTVTIERTPPAAAIERAATILKGQIKGPGQSLVFHRLEVSGDSYMLDYGLEGGVENFHVVVNANTGEIALIIRQP